VLAAVGVLDTKAESLVELQWVFGFHWSKAWRPTALVKLVHGTQIRSSRRLYATRALGLHDQATRKGAQQRAASATGNDRPRRRRGLRSRASRVQWPERSRPLGDHVHLAITSTWRSRPLGDHVHLPVSHPPKVCIAELVNSLKGVPSRRLKREFPSIKAFWSVKKSRGVLSTPSSLQNSGGAASPPP